MAKAELSVEISARLEKLNKGLSKAGNAFDNFNKELKKSFSASNLAMGAAIGIVAGLGAAFIDAGKTIKAFDQSQANLAAITGKTTKQIERLTNDAQRLGSTTRFTAVEVAGLQTEFAKLGFAEQEILNLSEATLNLAAATGEDLSSSAALAGSVVKSFQLETRDTARVVDVMTASFTKSALDMRKFEVGMRQVAPVAATANVSLEKVTASLGVLANNGIRAETAGTGLRNILLESAKQGRPYVELLQEISQSSDKGATAMDLFGKENAAVAVVLSENISSVNNLNSELKDVAGTAREMADKQLDTLQGQLTLTKSAWDGFILSIEDGTGIIGASVKNALTGIRQILGALTNFSATAELLNPFKDFSDLSKETLDYLLQVGETDTGKSIASLLAPINQEIKSLTSSEQINKIDKFRDKFTKAFLSQGEDLEDINVLWARYKQNVINAAEEQNIANKEAEKSKEASDLLADGLDNVNQKLDESNPKWVAFQQSVKEYNRQTGIAEANTWALGEALESLRKVPSVADIFPTKENIGFDPSAIDEITSFIDADSIDEDAKRAESSIAQMGDAMDKQMLKAKAVRFAVETAYQGLANVIVTSLGEAETAGGRFLRALIQNTSQVISAAAGQAVANAIVSGTQTGKNTGAFAAFTTPAFIASTVGSVIAAFAAIPKFAEGGIVGGSSTVGDRVTARLNSGEMVLNKTQQANLFSMANGGGGGSVNVVGKIRGRDILLSSERANNVRSRTRY